MPKPPPPPKPKPKGPPAPPSPKAAAGPPPPASKAAEPLAEVERALSVLHGRHPEAVRAERETQSALLAKKAQTDALAARAAVEDRRRVLLRAGAGAVAAALLITGWLVYSRKAAHGSEIERSVARQLEPYVASGFTRVSPARFGQTAIPLSPEEATCYVAATSEGPGDGVVHVERGNGALEGRGPVAFCTCGADKLTVRVADEGAGGGVGVANTAARSVGGDHGLSFLVPRPPLLAPPDECSAESLDAWLAAGHASSPPPEGAAPAPVREKLAKEGFTVTGFAAATLPFAVIPGAKDACALAFSTEPGDRLSLRVAGGERVVSEALGAIGVCTDEPKLTTAWRSGTGKVFVATVPAARIGGSHGLHEAAVRLGVGPATTWTAPGELTWDATATLRAAGVPGAEVADGKDGKPVTHAKLIAVSADGAMIRADATPEAFACEPALGKSTRDALCAQGGALSWHVVGSVGQAGIAEGPLPFWMRALAPTTDTPALVLELALLKLARRLVAEGYEATTLDGVTETAEGAKITGRAGDDVVVAVQLGKDDPWVSPCSAAEPWSLDAEPRPLALPPGAQKEVVCTPRSHGADRRTVVFRHPAK